MPEMHLRQPGFIYWARGPSTKNKGRIRRKIQRNRRLMIYLPKRTRKNLLSTWHGLLRF